MVIMIMEPVNLFMTSLISSMKHCFGGVGEKQKGGEGREGRKGRKVLI